MNIPKIKFIKCSMKLQWTLVWLWQVAWLTVLKYFMPDCLKASEISTVVTTADTGCPFPIGLPIVTMSGTTSEISSKKRHYSKTCVKLPLKTTQNKDLNDKWLRNEVRKYCRMLPLEHSAILLTSIWQLTLKKGAPGDQVRDLLCVQLASYLEKGPLLWIMPLHLHFNQKSDYDYDDD